MTAPALPRSCLAALSGRRRDPDTVKRDGWRELGILAVDVADGRLTWPERELIMRLGRRLYGPSAALERTGNGC